MQVGEVCIMDSSKYSEFAGIFCFKQVIELREHMSINDYAMDLVENKQLPYNRINSIRPLKLKTVKTFIKTNLANNFIKSSKSLADAHIFFVQNTNDGLLFYFDYRGLTNLTIQNWYLLCLIIKFPDWPNWPSNLSNLTWLVHNIK